MLDAEFPTGEKARDEAGVPMSSLSWSLFPELAQETQAETNATESYSESSLNVHVASDSPALTDRICEALQASKIGYARDAITPLNALIENGAKCTNGVDILFVASEFDSGVAKGAIESVRGCDALVVAVGRDCDARKILEVIRAGADDYLEVGPDFESELRTLVSRTPGKEITTRPSGQLYSVIGTSGGSGASLVASNVAAVLAQRKEQCGLLDLQLQGGDLAAMLNVTPIHTIADLFGSTTTLDRAMFEQSVVELSGGINLLAGPDLFSNVRQASPQLIQALVEMARSSFGHVVVDLEDVIHREQLWTLSSSNRVLIVFRLEFAALMRTRKYIEHLLNSGIRREQMVLIANRCGSSSNVPRDKAVKALGAEIAQQIPDDPDHILPAVNLGHPTAIRYPKAPFTKAIESIVDELTGEVSKETPIPGVRRLGQAMKASLTGGTSWLL